MKDITKRQSEVLDFISTFIEEHNYSPSIRQIAANFELTAKAAYDHVSALRKKGIIKTADRCSRTIEIVNNGKKGGDDFVRIPILGEVAAGNRVLSEENDNGVITLHRTMLKKNKTFFAVKVRGDSMIGIGIFDGDTAIIEKQESARNGDVVVARIDDGYVIKRFFKKNNIIKLQSENPKYHPTNYSDDVTIIGKLFSVFRSYS
ncbi:LexA repressor [Spirochaetia bacterium]|nr:LexA repressor [Spirochaetia bacterium]